MPTVVSTGTTRGGPNIQYPIGSSSLFQNRLGGGLGFGLASQRAARSAKKPGTPDIPVPSDLQGLTQTQNGFNDPFSVFQALNGLKNSRVWIPGSAVTQPTYDIHGRTTGTQTDYPDGYWAQNFGPGRQRLSELATAVNNYSGLQRPASLGAAAPGFGDTGLSGIKKLIQQRLGAMY